MEPQNLTKDGGVVKRVLKAAASEETSTPPTGARVVVEYVGRLTDGTVFDSNGAFPFKVGTGQVIQGWDIGVSSMRKGERAELTISPEYGYGSRTVGPIPANSVLVFEVELAGWQAAGDDSKPVSAPFEDIPGLRGPVLGLGGEGADSVWVRPGNGVTDFYYRRAASAWEWSPYEPGKSGEEDCWMPVTTYEIVAGAKKGKKAAAFNKDIIDWLKENNPAPPTDMPAKSLKELTSEFILHPGKATANEAAKLQSALGTNKMQPTAVFSGDGEGKVVVDATRVKSSDTLVIKNAKGTHYVIDSYCTKLMVDACDDCIIHITERAKVITSTCEVYKSSNLKMVVDIPLKTLQVEGCPGDVDLKFGKREDFQQLVWAGTRKFKLHFGDCDDVAENGFDQMLKELAALGKPSDELREDIDQFITRFVDGKLLTEKIIRLPNGFPTTAREKRAYDEKQAANMKALMKNAGLSVTRTSEKSGKKLPKRNEPCHCGSNNKYKKCCWNKDQQKSSDDMATISALAK